MTAAYFEDHPTNPDKVILRKPYSTDCPNCEYHRQRAQRWRDEAYRQAGHPLPDCDEPWSPVSIGVDMTEAGAHVVGIYAMSDETSQIFYAKHHPAPQRTWESIETAPKDGTDILLMYVHIDTQVVHSGFWLGASDTDDESDIGWWSYEHSEVSRIKLDDWMTPTYWLPLPKLKEKNEQTKDT